MKKLSFVTCIILGISLIFGITTSCATKPKDENTSVSPKTTKKEPEDPPNIQFAKKLQAELEKNNTKGAIALFEEIPESLKDDQDLKLLLGALYISDSQYDNAINVGNEVLETNPTNSDALELISHAQRAKGDSKSYKATLNKILEKEPYNVTANIQKAEDYSLNRKWKLARECYKKALRTEPDNLDAKFGYAQTSYYCDDVDVAEKTFLEIIEKDPKNSQSLAYLGKIYGEDENYLKASKYISEALKYESKNYDYWMDYGKYLRYQGKYDNAISAWKTASNLDPSYFLAYAYLAGVHDELENFEDALYYYKKVVETNPKYFYAYEEMGILAYHTNQYEDAITYFNKAYDYSASYAYKLMVAASYLKLGNKVQAKNSLTPILKKLDRSSIEYEMVRFWSDTYTRTAENSLTLKITKEDNSNKRGKMLFYMGLYYELNGSEQMANEYYTKVTNMNAPMFFEYRIAEWSLKNGATSN